MTLPNQIFTALVLFAISDVSTAEVPPPPQEQLEAMPFKFKAMVQSIDVRVGSSDDCRISKLIYVSLDKAVSLRDSILPQAVKLWGSGYQYRNGCVGGSGAAALEYLRIGQEIVVHAGAPNANGEFFISHYSQIERIPE